MQPCGYVSNDGVMDAGRRPTICPKKNLLEPKVRRILLPLSVSSNVNKGRELN